MKYFFPHLLFGHKKVYVEEIKKASLERLASCARQGVAKLIFSCRFYVSLVIALICSGFPSFMAVKARYVNNLHPYVSFLGNFSNNF
jgi:hypothetical protein